MLRPVINQIRYIIPRYDVSPGSTRDRRSLMGTEILGKLSGIDPVVRAFLEKINTLQGPPVYRMSPEHARTVLSKLQASAAAPMMPAAIEETDIPGGPTGKVHVHIVRPQGSTGELPVTMYFHGGGWVLGGFDTHERLVRELANGSGSAMVFVDYTPSPGAKYPVPPEEGYRAMEYIAENGRQHNLDSSRLAVAGDSVGGNMAAVVAMMAKQRDGPDIRFQALFYPVTDASFETGSYRQFDSGYWLARDGMKWFWDNYLPDKKERNQPMASPMRASVDQLKGLPPTLLITDENDVLRDEGEAYAHKLIEAGVPTTGVRFLGTIHDFMMLNPLAGTPPTRSAIDLASDLLRNSFAR
jgi:acetyl esterase